MNFLIKSALTLGSIVGAQQAAKALRRIDIDDALGYVGLERQKGALPTVALVALSAVVGAGAALLLAPTSGPELRSRLSDRLDDAKNRFQKLSTKEGGRAFSEMTGS